ncbi:MAG: hypothetical protein WBO71_07765, partial [Thermoanaerobaculia bacterium]
MRSTGDARVSVVQADGRIRATYVLTLSSGESPEARAKAIAFEQTVELPPERVSGELVSRVVGRVERLEPGEDETWLTKISYSSELAGGNFSQLMNLLYG